MGIKVNIEYSPAVNFAMQQNRAGFIRRIELVNPADGLALKDLEVRVESDPAFIRECRLHVSGIAPGTSFATGNVETVFSADVLRSLTERIEGTFDLIVTAGVDEIYRKTYPVALLAFDQWMGTGTRPELIPAFVTPNHPAIAPVLRRASEILGEWTGNASLDGYGAGVPGNGNGLPDNSYGLPGNGAGLPGRVKYEMGAIYEALSELGIAYCGSPAGYEESGQRIRLVDRVLRDRLASDMDMALLYAGCLEAVGIHPLIALTGKRAVAGAWLIDSTFPDSVCRDSSLLSKSRASGINDVLLLDPAGMLRGRQLPFDQAVQKGESAVCAAGDEFELFIDVAKARKEHIRPLPLLESGDINPDWEAAEESLHAKPEGIKGGSTQVDPFEKVVVDKQALWERKLLDLTMGNRLVNARPGRCCVQIVSTDLSKLEDSLVAGESLSVIGAPDCLGGADGGSAGAVKAGSRDGVPGGSRSGSGSDNDAVWHRALTPADDAYDSVKSDLKSRRLRTFLDKDKLAASLKELYRQSRDARDAGANTLYLTLGTLKWYEPENTDTPRFAPLLLVPVDLVRRSAASGYTIRGREEDTMFNTTLLEKLRLVYEMEIPGLNPLPKDGRGVDVQEVLNIVRRCVMEYRGWDVEETVTLGIYDFAKFLMWNDIHNNTDLLRSHPMVNSLLTGVVDSGVSAPVQSDEDLDETVAPGDVMLPISADSSQLEAIKAALSGKSFILHGPPGTGKSQTITNIIANAMYSGKRVLFVAEKRAALEVVQKRLEEIGLGPFCFDMHSDMAKKTGVMDKFKHLMQISQETSSETFRAEAERLKVLRGEIKAYMDALHRKYPLGLSLYDSLSRYCGYPAELQAFSPGADWLLKLRPEDMPRIDDALSQYITACTVCGDPAGHPLAGMGTVTGPVREVSQLLCGLPARQMKQSMAQCLALLFGDSSDRLTKSRFEAFRDLVALLLESDSLSAELVSADETELSRMEKMLKCSRKRAEVADELCRNYSRRILNLDPEVLRAEYESAMGKGPVGKFIGLEGFRRKLAVYTCDGRRPAAERIPRDLDLLEKYVGYSRKLSDAQWNCEPDKAQAGLADARTVGKLLAVLGGSGSGVGGSVSGAGVSALRQGLALALQGGIESFRQCNAVVLREFLDSSETFLAGLAQLRTMMYLNLPEAEAEGWAGKTADAVVRWAENLDKLRDWAVYNREKDALSSLGLEALAEAVERGEIRPQDSPDALRKGVYRAYAEYIISREPALSEFHGVMFEEKIARFRKLCEGFQDMTRRELYARISQSLPKFAVEASLSPSVGLLLKNIANNCRGLSLRSFFDLISDILPRITPCMLMSPLSASQYIGAAGRKFDLVIFDEASQIPTCEAVGAIARGSAVIIAGDPNQLPPTPFFKTDTFDEDNAVIEDLESILDDALALSLPSVSLKWHYRSRHESLIAFSNAKYYDNRLLTFPSPDDRQTKVLYQFVPEGVYTKGGSRQNRAEAEAVIAEIEARLSDPQRRDESIGVITFNICQQSLIEDLLDDLFRSKPELERAAQECREPIFVKNLENVQGDERDVILFSVGYGPDDRGVVTQNFGPLNGTGGWRRLNVAVSRARCEMKVFSTLRSEQISVAETCTNGVEGLKSFLEYAEMGRESKLYRTASSARTEDNVVQAIAERLRALGYGVDTNIGCSGFRVDIGIIDPEHPESYLLGILCDGYNSGATRTVRDREIVQLNVLRSLGWRLQRVWTMEWLTAPDKVVEKICKLLFNFKD